MSIRVTIERLARADVGKCFFAAMVALSIEGKESEERH
jgi:hypothetical protein